MLGAAVIADQTAVSRTTLAEIKEKVDLGLPAATSEIEHPVDQKARSRIVVILDPEGNVRAWTVDPSKKRPTRPVGNEDIDDAHTPLPLTSDLDAWLRTRAQVIVDRIECVLRTQDDGPRPSVEVVVPLRFLGLDLLNLPIQVVEGTPEGFAPCVGAAVPVSFRFYDRLVGGAGLHKLWRAKSAILSAGSRLHWCPCSEELKTASGTDLSGHYLSDDVICLGLHPGPANILSFEETLNRAPTAAAFAGVPVVLWVRDSTEEDLRLAQATMTDVQDLPETLLRLRQRMHDQARRATLVLDPYDDTIVKLARRFHPILGRNSKYVRRHNTPGSKS